MKHVYIAKFRRVDNWATCPNRGILLSRREIRMTVEGKDLRFKEVTSSFLTCAMQHPNQFIYG